MTMRSILLIILLLALSGCGGSSLGGTETGNPGGPTSSIPTGANPNINNFATQMIDSICSKLSTCYPSLTSSSCQSGVLAVTNVGSSLGLPSGTTSTLQNIVDEENAGTITPQSTAANRCISDIQSLTCGSSTVGGAYSSGTAANFNRVYTLLSASSASCAGVF